MHHPYWIQGLFFSYIVQVIVIFLAIRTTVLLVSFSCCIFTSVPDKLIVVGSNRVVNGSGITFSSVSDEVSVSLSCLGVKLDVMKLVVSRLLNRAISGSVRNSFLNSSSERG